jgi:hypothetical protein
MRLFNLLFAGMGTVLLSVAGWIALSVAHLPAIEQKMDDFILAATGKLDDHETRIRQNSGQLSEHEARIRTIEAQRRH